MKWLVVPRFDQLVSAANISAALLILRLIVGVAFLVHGYGKILNPTTWMGPDSSFPGFLLALAALAEFGGGLAIILGLLTPLACLGILANMTVAIFAVHLPNGDPFLNGWELPLIFMGVFILLLGTGPGRYSLDYALFHDRRVDIDSTDRRSVSGRPTPVSVH